MSKKNYHGMCESCCVCGAQTLRHHVHVYDVKARFEKKQTQQLRRASDNHTLYAAKSLGISRSHRGISVLKLGRAVLSFSQQRSIISYASAGQRTGRSRRCPSSNKSSTCGGCICPTHKHTHTHTHTGIQSCKKTRDNNDWLL